MATDFLSLISQIPGLISNFSGSSAPYLQQQKQLAGQQNQISQALLQGPNNPLYQQMYGQYREQGANQLGQGIAQLQAQNRMNTSMGRTPLLNQERGGEQLFRNLMQGYQGLGTQADQQTRQNLAGAGAATNSALAGYGNTTNYANSATSQNLAGYQGIYNLLRGTTQSQGQQTPNASPQNYMQQMMPTGSSGAGNYSNFMPQQQNQQQLAPYSGYSY